MPCITFCEKSEGQMFQEAATKVDGSWESSTSPPPPPTLSLSVYLFLKISLSLSHSLYVPCPQVCMLCLPFANTRSALLQFSQRVLDYGDSVDMAYARDQQEVSEGNRADEIS